MTRYDLAEYIGEKIAQHPETTEMEPPEVEGTGTEDEPVTFQVAMGAQVFKVTVA